MVETSEQPQDEHEKPKDPEPGDEDDRRAAAASANRKRTLQDWEEKKRRWRQMGVPPALPAHK